MLIASVGLTSTLDAQINSTFDALRVTRVVLHDNRVIVEDPLFALDSIDANLGALPGVIAGGYTSSTDSALSADVALSNAHTEQSFSAVLATPGALSASGARIASGRIYDDTPALVGEPLVLLGPEAASRLGIDEVDGNSALVINGRPVAISGVLGGYGSEIQLDQAVILDPRVASELGLPIPEAYSALIRTEPGYVASVARSAPLAVRPQDPQSVGITYPPEPERLREGVQGSLNTLALAVAGLSVLVGGAGIANSMINAASQRTGEIGLRRSIGGRPHQIAIQILAEGCFIGGGGAIVGTLGGVGVLVAVCWINGWQAVLPWWCWWAPAVGGCVLGALAGLLPALRAARLNPATALRSS